MGAPQFAQQVDNSETSKKVFTTAEITANSANQLDEDLQAADLSSSTEETGEQNISGAQAIVIAVNETSGSAANVTVEWMDGAGNVLFTETPSSLQSLSNDADYARLAVKSTHVNVSFSGSSTDTDATVNAH